MELNNNSKKKKLKKREKESLDEILLNAEHFCTGIFLGVLLLLVSGSHLFFMWKNELKVHHLRKSVDISCVIVGKQFKGDKFYGGYYLYLSPKSGNKVIIEKEVPKEVYSVINEEGEGDLTIKVEKYKLSTQDLLFFKENKPGIFWNTLLGLVFIALSIFYIFYAINGCDIDNYFYPRYRKGVEHRTILDIIGKCMIIFPIVIVLSYIIYWIF